MSAVTPTHEVIAQTTNRSRRRGCLFLVRRAALYIMIGVIVLSLVGFVYETAAEASDRQAFPAPGQMLNIDGRPMHILCMGEGGPTVILDAGAGHFSAMWAWVQPAVAQSTRVCAYDRAGYGWSEPGPEPRDAQQIAAELHKLLDAAGVEPPYILVGHSLGGIHARVYNAQYPGEVVGMVLIDATHPDNWIRQGESIETLQAMGGVFAVLSRVGLMRLYAGGQSFGLPPTQDTALKANLASTRYWDTQRAEAAAGPATLDEGRAAGDLGDLPLAVLAAVDYPDGSHRDTELALQTELAALSTNSTYQVIAGARHITLVTNEQYAEIVSKTIFQVIEAVRTRQSLAE